MAPALARRTEVLRHGIDLSEPLPPAPRRDDLRRQLGIPQEAMVVISVANLRREKDYPNLMRAAAMVLAELPDTVFLAVGQGPLKEELAELHRQMGLGEGFRFLGYREDVRDLLAAADVFALGSAQEGLPVAIMEALHQGLPIVATNVGGVSEAVQPDINGCLIPAANDAALASAILTVLQEPSMRKSMGAASREMSAEFDIHWTVEMEEATYERLVGDRPTGWPIGAARKSS